MPRNPMVAPDSQPARISPRQGQQIFCASQAASPAARTTGEKNVTARLDCSEPVSPPRNSAPPGFSLGPLRLRPRVVGPRGVGGQLGVGDAVRLSLGGGMAEYRSQEGFPGE